MKKMHTCQRRILAILLLGAVAIAQSACEHAATSGPSDEVAASSAVSAAKTDAASPNSNGAGKIIRRPVPPGTALRTAEFLAAIEQTGAKHIIIQVFAESCGPCITEALELNDRLQAWQDRDVAILGLGMDTSKSSVEAFYRQSGERIRFPLYCAPWFAEQQEVALTPTLFVYDRKGKQLFRVDAEAAPDGLLPALESKLNELSG